MFSTMRSVRAEIVRKGFNSSAATKRTEERVRLRWTRKPARETRALPGTGSLPGGEDTAATEEAFRLAAETDRLAAYAPRNQESGFGRFGTLFVHEWNVVGRDDSRDVADHDACNALNRFRGLIVYPHKDRNAHLRRVIVRSIVARKRAGVAVPTRAGCDSQTKGSVTQEGDAVDEIVVGPGAARLAGGVQLDPTSDIVHI